MLNLASPFKLYRTVFIFFLIFKSLTAGSALATDKITVLASIPPYASLAADIGGDLVHSQSLIEQGMDPHFFDIKPSAVSKIRSADIFFAAGFEYEASALPAFMDINPDLIIIDLVAVARLEDEHYDHEAMDDKDDHDDHDHESADKHDDHDDDHDHESADKHDDHGHDDHDDHHDHESADKHDNHGHDDHDHHGDHDGYNIHAWLAPKLLQVQAAAIYSALQDQLADDSMKNELAGNYQKLIAQLQADKAELDRSFAPYKGRKVFSYHALGQHFSNEFGLEEVPLTISHVEPSLRAIRQFVELLDQNETNFFLISEDSHLSAAETLAEFRPVKPLKVQEFYDDWRETLQNYAAVVLQAVANKQ